MSRREGLHSHSGSNTIFFSIPQWSKTSLTTYDNSFEEQCIQGGNCQKEGSKRYLHSFPLEMLHLYTNSLFMNLPESGLHQG